RPSSAAADDLRSGTCMNKYLRDLQILAWFAAVVLFVADVLALGLLTTQWSWLTVTPGVFLSTLVALTIWFALRAQVPSARATLRTACRGGLLLGAPALVLGILASRLLYPDSNLGPLLGILVTGPLGFVIGVAAGL